MKGANMADYIKDSTACLDAIDATGASFSELFALISQHKAPDSKVSVYPDVILSGTDLLATFSPLARSCFYSSMEARDDFLAYIAMFESFTDYSTQFGTNALANYFTLKEKFNTIVYDITYIHNATLASFHIGELMFELVHFEPQPVPEPKPESVNTVEPLNFDFKDDGTKEILSEKVNNIYEAVYVFLTSLSMADGVHLDSCKYYASQIASKIYEGSQIIKQADKSTKPEGVFQILDSLEFATGAVMYCVDSGVDVVKSCKYLIKNFSAKTIPE